MSRQVALIGGRRRPRRRSGVRLVAGRTLRSDCDMFLHMWLCLDAPSQAWTL